MTEKNRKEKEGAEELGLVEFLNGYKKVHMIEVWLL
jgi:hypothetical protein